MRKKTIMTIEQWDGSLCARCLRKDFRGCERFRWPENCLSLWPIWYVEQQRRRAETVDAPPAWAVGRCEACARWEKALYMVGKSKKKLCYYCATRHVRREVDSGAEQC